MSHTPGQMPFTEGTTYRFKKPRTIGGTHKDNGFNLVHLRREGKFEMFKSPTCPWLESFTREQLGDFQVTEVRK